MAKGEGETSYVKNSTHQKKALIRTKPVIEKAVIDVCMDLLHPTMTVVDLGCSAGQNTLLFVSNVIEAICCNHDKLRGSLVELQIFLNDLPGNDFNHVFQSLGRFKESIALPDGFAAKREMHLNNGNIYIARTTPPYVVKLYQEHFQKDMLLFLKLRYEELVLMGKWYATVYLFFRKIGRPQPLQCNAGPTREGKLNSFNLLFYGPSVTEVKMVINKSGLFDINHVELFESNWDPRDNSVSDDVDDPLQSGMNVSKSLRAVLEPLFTSHFGESVLDTLFNKLAYNVAEHLAREKTKYSIIVMSLKKT
ncbi:hypothetical protein ZWY2020_035996 [Hordeum vulgare]|nr:hypothetical protein ZWY2020_035996 [Hordeum vulgare]